jgi:hypothetical protein
VVKNFHDSEKSQGRVKLFEQNICVIPEKIHASQNKFGLESRKFEKGGMQMFSGMATW